MATLLDSMLSQDISAQKGRQKESADAEAVSILLKMLSPEYYSPTTMPPSSVSGAALGSAAGKRGESRIESNRLIVQDDKKHWDAFASESDRNAEMVNNIRKFTSSIVNGQVMYQIPITHDNGCCITGL